MNQINENSIIHEIQNEYEKINNKWQRLHYHTFIGLVLFGILVECTLAVILYNVGYIEIPLLKYFLKYILTPLIINTCFILTAIWTMHTTFLQQKMKTYIISLLFVGICFVFYTIHIVFASLYLIFTVPVLLTVVYGDYCLTTVTAFFSIAAKIISDFFITWDSDKIGPLTNDHELSDFFISICILIAFYVACIIVMRFDKEKNTASIQKEIERYHMQQRLITDELTQIYNRTALRNEFQKMENDPRENTYVLVMIDLDNFKALNDTMGHDKGDQYLKEFGIILRKNCTDEAIPFRFGGDEFCILFKNKPLEHIITICKSIQDDLKNSAINKSGIPLTASVGIASYKNQISARQLLRNTDLAMYRSKSMKDDICVYEDMDRSDLAGE